MSEALKTILKNKAHELGFTLFGVASVADDTLPQALTQYDAWLGAGHAQAMQYLARHREKKSNPELLLSGAKSVVCVGLPYAVECAETEDRPKISKYALGRDYHDVVEEKLKSMMDFLKENESQASCRSFVDAQAVFDRFWASRAGLGWVGKNTCLIHRQQGSFFFIGGFLTSVDFAADAPYTEHCGRCTKCIDACPTQAIEKLPTGRYAVVSEKCIGYHTIENRGPTPESVAKRSGTWLAGCDICQDVCPWNDPITLSKEFVLSNPVALSSFKELASWSAEEFNSKLSGFAMKRMKYEGFLKNLAIATANALPSSSDKRRIYDSILAKVETLPSDKQVGVRAALNLLSE